MFDELLTITNVKTLRERLIFARELRGLSQGELAGLAKCAQSTIGNVESGERQTLRNLVMVARVLRISVDWLYDGRGPKPTGSVLKFIDNYTAPDPQPLIAAEPTGVDLIPPTDPHIREAVRIMSELKEHQREGALAALRTHVGHLGPPRDGQALQVA